MLHNDITGSLNSVNLKSVLHFKYKTMVNTVIVVTILSNLNTQLVGIK